MRGRVLLIEDDRPMRELLTEALKRRDYLPVGRSSADEAFQELVADEFDAVVTDLNLAGMSGIEFCRRLHASHPDLPVVIITAFGSLDSAVAAIRAGAYDFLTKPFEVEALSLILDRAVQYRALKKELERLQGSVAASRRFEELIGDSPDMRRLYGLLARAAQSEASVLITGETGTGKELVARALHGRSRRREGPFVALSCAAMPEQLLESELFGHLRGAFTDARTDRTGLFHLAGGGTLFLDEIGDMPLGLQPKLLRALQERRARPVGGEEELPFDVRIVAATNRDLEALVEEGRFREDLYFRLKVIQVEAPPLRTRGNDLLLLAQHFLARFASRTGKQVRGLQQSAAEKLLSYSWPGNVRELQNAMERAVALTVYREVTVDDLPEEIRQHRRSQAPLWSEDPSHLAPLEEVERRYILRVLEAVGDQKALAARILGLDRKTLYRKLERYQQERSDPRADRERYDPGEAPGGDPPA